MKKITALVIMTATIAFSLISMAESGPFIEPSLTYESSSSSIDFPSPFTNSSGSVNGAGLGLRLGAHVMDTLFIAADVRYSRPQFKDSSNNLDALATSINYGGVIGVQTPILGLRLWGGYVFAGELHPEESNNVQFKFSDPKGYRFGAGLRILMLSVNLEYQSLKYDHTSLEKIGPFAPNTSLDSSQLTNNSYIVSVSFPLSL